jgi:SnoaL-like domain
MMNNDSSPSKAAEIAMKHVEAFSTHDYETARSLLADDVHFMLITSIPGFPNPFEGNGVEEFMKALTSGNTLVPGSLQVIHSIGDDHQALITVNVKGTLPTQEPITLLAARHYMIDEHEKITNELVIIAHYEGKV